MDVRTRAVGSESHAVSDRERPLAAERHRRRIMEAIYRSAAERKPILLEAVAGLDTTRGPELRDES